MASLTQFIRREIINRELEFIATVISDPQLLNFDLSNGGNPGAAIWVVDLEIGGTRPVLKVPIKASGSGTRFYAQLGQTVKVRRTALGRMFVVGPGDTTIATKSTTTYSLDTEAVQATTNTGFSRQLLPLEFYSGTSAMKGNPNITFDSSGTITRDVGSFIDDGFVTTDVVRIAGTTLVLNNGDVTLTGVAALVLTTGNTLFTQAAKNGVSIGVLGTSLWASSTTFFFPFSRIIDGDGNPV